jgi:hypothetical protein
LDEIRWENGNKIDDFVKANKDKFALVKQKVDDMKD